MTKTELIVRDMCQPGKASFIVGGQAGSESKGSAAAWLALKSMELAQPFTYVTTNAGAQAGHTSIHKGKRRVSFHMPTAPWIMQDEGYNPIVYLNGGSVIDPEGFEKEIEGYKGDLFVHPNAAIITDECREAENRPNSAQTKIASTRKGVGEAIARKVTRSAQVAKDHPFIRQFVRRIDLNWELRNDARVLVEVPQGVSLSLNHSIFYPHCTSRDCSTTDAASAAGIHPSFCGSSLVVLRSYPIRVGHLIENGETLGESGACFRDQHEISWEDIGVTAERTTVTNRIRRVFTFSIQQLRETFALCRPDVVMLTFCNYIKDPDYFTMIDRAIFAVSKELFLPPPHLIYEYGPTTDDIGEDYHVPTPASTQRALSKSA
jgi:adenylosuccinate synthase